MIIAKRLLPRFIAPLSITRKVINLANTGSYKIIRTTIPTVYTLDFMGVEYGLQDYLSKANLLFTSPAKFLTPSDLKYKLPMTGIPEFAFIGRSNVGKSSLISSLLSERKLVRVSKEPGCTTNINYYTFLRNSSNNNNNNDSSNHLIYLVDLPGYGFAKSSKDDQKRWQDLILSYFGDRSQAVLRRVYVLVDSRHGIKEADLNMMQRLSEAATPFQVVLTKSDLASKADLQKSLQSVFIAIASKRGQSCMPYVHTVSAVGNIGLDALKLDITQVHSVWGHDRTEEQNN